MKGPVHIKVPLDKVMAEVEKAMAARRKLGLTKKSPEAAKKEVKKS